MKVSGFANEPGEKFCGGCGMALREPAPAKTSDFSSAKFGEIVNSRFHHVFGI